MNTITSSQALLAGVLGAAAMTILILLAPGIGLPDMNIGSLLGSMMQSDPSTGWLAHFVIGALLAWLYAVFFAPHLPWHPTVRGALFSLLPWAFGQLSAMPLLEDRVFDRWFPLAMASLVVHLVYGAIVGGSCGGGLVARSRAHHRRKLRRTP